MYISKCDLVPPCTLVDMLNFVHELVLIGFQIKFPITLLLECEVSDILDNRVARVGSFLSRRSLALTRRYSF